MNSEIPHIYFSNIKEECIMTIIWSGSLSEEMLADHFFKCTKLGITNRLEMMRRLTNSQLAVLNSEGHSYWPSYRHLCRMCQPGTPENRRLNAILIKKYGTNDLSYKNICSLQNNFIVQGVVYATT